MGAKVAACPGAWIAILKLQESLAEHFSVLNVNVPTGHFLPLDFKRTADRVHFIGQGHYC